MLWLYVALGGAAGSVLRYLLGTAFHSWVPGTFPVGTLVINVTGSFLLGLILQSSNGNAAVSPELRVLLAVGFCGGYTTFSAFSWETLQLIHAAQWGRALGYVALSVIVSLGATLLGVLAGGLRRGS
ncbi:MAG: fluoride efflux transporter CrcB [Gemmatimonadales bacterium]